MTSVQRAKARLMAHALSLPGAREDKPWGETVAKVGKKVFVFFGRDAPNLFLGVKLGRSLLYARSLAFTHRFGYGLDDSGWVALRFAMGDDVPVDMLRAWIEESYAAVAPKTRGSPSAGAARRALARAREARARPRRRQRRGVP